MSLRLTEVINSINEIVYVTITREFTEIESMISGSVILDVQEAKLNFDVVV